MFMVPGEVGGSEPLLTNLVRAMAPKTDIAVYALRGFSEAYPDIAKITEVVEVPWSKGAQGLRIAAENTWLQLSARKKGLDLIHHGVGATPFLRSIPAAVTVHDIQYKHYPQNFSTAKRWWLTLNLPHTSRTCAVVAVPSEWVRQDVVSRLGADPSKVVVVPFGSEGLFGDDPATAAESVERYGLQRPYLIYPGRTYPHKNHLFLIRAFARLTEDIDLVFTGAPWPRDSAIRAEVARLGLENRVKTLGLVPRRDLAGLYAGAVALCYPTRFEGFGAPVLEAMTMSCPVIASNTTSVPEVVADAGVLLSPDDADAWVAAMQRMSSDETYRAGWIAKGLERAGAFTWERSASTQIAAYQRALA